MLKNVVINGNFMTYSQITGRERYARELVFHLDELLNESDNVTLVMPHTIKNMPQFKNIKVQQIGFSKYGTLWEQTTFRNYVKKRKDAICVNFCNVTPLFVKPGITAILDIMYKVNPSHYTTFRNRLSRYWHMFQYWYIARHEKKIITISNFCKNEIERHYPKSKGKVEVIPCAWQHVLNYHETENWQEKYPLLKEKQFFFSMATLSRNKNGKWIIEVAKRNPDCVFAMAGKNYETLEYTTIPENVHMLGYVPDEDACALIKHCRAFLFPSLYEGFGLPPLEALGLGADVISSNTASLPEVLGDAVHYIDPLDYNIDLDEILNKTTSEREETLSHFDWKKSAMLLYEVCNEV